MAHMALHRTAALLPAADPQLRQQQAGFSGRPGSAAPLHTSARSAPRARLLSSILAQAQTKATASKPTFKGIYGDWTLEQEDIREVWGYRAGLSVTAAAIVLDTLLPTVAAWQPEASELRPVLRSLQDPIGLVGAAGFGVSLTLIHIYVKPLKQFIQALFAAGLAGSTYLMATQTLPVPEHVATHPGAVLLVGPLFAAFTGVAFKEGLCYGKPECALLFFLTPSLLLGHMSGLLPEPAKQAALAAFVLLSTLFALRKYTQPIEADIGDKSVFQYLALSAEEQEALTRQARSRQRSDGGPEGLLEDELEI